MKWICDWNLFLTWPNWRTVEVPGPCGFLVPGKVASSALLPPLQPQIHPLIQTQPGFSLLLSALTTLSRSSSTSDPRVLAVIVCSRCYDCNVPSLHFGISLSGVHVRSLQKNLLFNWPYKSAIYFIWLHVRPCSKISYYPFTVGYKAESITLSMWLSKDLISLSKICAESWSCAAVCLLKCPLYHHTNKKNRDLWRCVCVCVCLRVCVWGVRNRSSRYKYSGKVWAVSLQPL